MAGPSKIEWTEATWNPVVGCSIVSPGCTNCYAMKMAARIEAMQASSKYTSKEKPQHYVGATKKVNGNAVWTGKLALAPGHILLEPLRRKKPTTYFVNSMGDLFHENTPDEWIDKVLAVMALSPQHTFQVLTKRAERMRRYFNDPKDRTRYYAVKDAIVEFQDSRGVETYSWKWPLPNLWLGVSTERQQEADERIPLLLQTPAAVRFISAEPLIGAIDLTRCGSVDALLGHDFEAIGDIRDAGDLSKTQHPPGLNWVIVGGESGPGARPMHPDWARSLRDQCAAAGVPFFFKQWGAWRALNKGEPETWAGHQERGARDAITLPPADGFGVAYLELFSKKSAGRLLDGKAHDGMPGR